ncbi:DUF262 domain-containing protein [Lentzea sp. NBRC 102530]|uniref:DUF262 domain-containing protein n=1 Tax=Lentzea sp. NBRC 102530 TaxID=3032201 RepID=UPI002556A77B|nr:DUF262 domain-containing protein [Lentzea sp. NBRC 102530]
MSRQVDEDDEAIEPDADDYEPPLFELETAGSETEGDIENPQDIHYNDVVLAPSDWTVETILSQLKSGSFELDPDFQRRNAWTDIRKSKFIESLMLGLPIPQIVFAERDEDDEFNARYVVIDGKQRLLTLDAFYSESSPLRLQGLTVLPQLNGMTRSEAADDPSVSRYIRRLANRTIRTVVIRRWPDDSFLHLVFHRINHQTLALSAQELRQALQPGRFTKFADIFAGSSSQLHDILGATQRPDFRMRDVELLVRFMAYRFRLSHYKGNLKKFLDETCKEFNSAWPSMEQEITESAIACNAAIDSTRKIFGNRAFRRFTENGTWETRFNRAVFDAMLYYFADPNVATEAESKSGDVLAAYELLSAEDRRFTQSLALSTKTVQATEYRLEAWGRTLQSVLSVELSIPTLSANGRSIIVGEGD